MVNNNILDGRTVDVYHHYTLQHTQNGHNKFWNAYAGVDLSPDPVASANPHVVVLRWGRIGTAGSKAVNRFPNKTSAMKYLNSRYQHKMAAGYESALQDWAPASSAVVNTVSTYSGTQLTEWDLL